MLRCCPICDERFSLRLDACPACGSALAITEHPCYEARLEDTLGHAALPLVVRAAEAALLHAEPSRTAALLARAIRRRWHDPLVTAALVRAVGRLRGSVAHDALFDALDHESLLVRAAAARSLQGCARRAS